MKIQSLAFLEEMEDLIPPGPHLQTTEWCWIATAPRILQSLFSSPSLLTPFRPLPSLGVCCEHKINMTEGCTGGNKEAIHQARRRHRGSRMRLSPGKWEERNHRRQFEEHIPGLSRSKVWDERKYGGRCKQLQVITAGEVQRNAWVREDMAGEDRRAWRSIKDSLDFMLGPEVIHLKGFKQRNGVMRSGFYKDYSDPLCEEWAEGGKICDKIIKANATF